MQERADGRWVIVSERKTGDGGTVAVYSDVTELKQREKELSVKTNALDQLSRQLAKYLSPQVYESIFTGRSEVKVASRRKKLTIFFSDLEGFTETTERLEPEDLTQLLNHYLTEMSKIALQYGGTINRYVGDAILIFFGDPETQGVKEDAVACVKNGDRHAQENERTGQRLARVGLGKTATVPDWHQHRFLYRR